jgi:hypothetical protein
MKLRLSAAAVLLTLSLAVIAVVATPATAAAPSKGSLTVPIASTSTSPNSFVGSLTVTGFKTINGALYAVGTLTGTINGTTPVTQSVTVPVTIPTGTCQILDLTLGPLHLDLLGLVVDLNQVHLTITAQSGPGNLLGNLLCDVANLLNGNGTGLSGLLNQILGQL